jgi:hypothetical protein
MARRPAATRASWTLWAASAVTAMMPISTWFLWTTVVRVSWGRTGMPVPGGAADFGGVGVEEGDDVEAVGVEAGVVGEGHAEVAGADDHDVAGPVDAELLDELLLEA